MTALRLLLRDQARRRWRGWLGLALLVGAISGVLIAALAGARRTETAYARFLEGTNAFDVILTNGTNPADYNQQFDFHEVAALPQVLDAASIRYYIPSGTTATGRAITASDLSPFASLDGRFGTEVNEARLLEGRLPRGDREVAVTPAVAERLGLEVGTTMRLRLTGPAAADGAIADTAETAFRVVGIAAMQTGFPPMSGGLPPPVLLSTTYARSHPDSFQVFAVRLHRGAQDAAAFERELTRLAGGEPIISGNRTDLRAVERTMSAQSTSLRLFAGLVGTAAVLMLGQVLVRQGSSDTRDDQCLRAMGVTSTQLRTARTMWAALVGLAAAGTAVVLAVALSPLTPVGLARQAELRPGLEVNVAHVVGGAVIVSAIFTGLGALAAWLVDAPGGRRDASRAPVERPSRAGRLVAGAGGSVAATTGVRMALHPGVGRSATPVRFTVAGATVAVAMITGVIAFSTSLGHLLDDPELYGWNWDVQVGDAFSPPLDDDAAQLVAQPAVDAVALGTTTRIEVEGTLVDVLATESSKGVIEPTVLEGRAPTGPGEILLGTRTLRELDVELGDTVHLASGERSAPVVIVGRGVLAQYAGVGLGDGAMLTFEGIRRLLPDSIHNVVLVRLRPGEEGDEVLAGLVERQQGSTGWHLYLPEKPSDLTDLERIGGLPFVLAGTLGAMSIAMLAFTLTSSVRHRRSELAILKALGLVRREVAATVAWQASAIALIAVVLGLPLGAAVGHVAWRAFADQLGLPPRTATPVTAMGLVALATFLLANLTAAIPGRWAARTRSGRALRVE